MSQGNEKRDIEIEMLSALMQMGCLDDEAYEKALVFAKKSTRTGRIMIKATRKVPPARLSKMVGGFNNHPVAYHRYEIIGETSYTSFGAKLQANIVIYELRSI